MLFAQALVAHEALFTVHMSFMHRRERIVPFVFRDLIAVVTMDQFINYSSLFNWEAPQAVREGKRLRILPLICLITSGDSVLGPQFIGFSSRYFSSTETAEFTKFTV